MEGLGEMDLLLLMVEPDRRPGGGDRYIADALSGLAPPLWLVVNKIDTVSRGNLLATIDAFKDLAPFEAVFTFENYTIPSPVTEAPDGSPLKDEELYWGYLRPGIGVGIRKSLETPHADQNMNMAALSLIAEPGYLYFDDSGETADNFTEPQDTFEARFVQFFG